MGKHKPRVPPWGTASKWAPPPEMLRIASERTRAIVQTWGSAAIWGPVDIMVLAESCYMQGINDSIDALHQTKNRGIT